SYAPGSLAFTPDGRAEFVARRSGTWHVVIDGAPGPAFSGIGRESVVFSPDGRRHAYSAQTPGGRQVVVVDGEVGRDHDHIIGRPAFSLDGRHVAYGVEDAANQSVVEDGSQGPAFSAISPSGPTFDRD